MTEPKNRPLSPHLQVYRLPMAALMSITHRITGAILAGGMFLIAALLVGAAISLECFNNTMIIAASPFGQFVLIVWATVLYYHTLNGIRHLVWDMNTSTVTKDTATWTGWIIILCTIALTVATWCYASQGY